MRRLLYRLFGWCLHEMVYHDYTGSGVARIGLRSGFVCDICGLVQSGYHGNLYNEKRR